MPYVPYTFEGKEYTIWIDDVKIDQTTLTNTINQTVTGNSLINWTNPNPDVPIQMGNLGFTPQFQNTLNSLSYLGNMMKATNEDDYNRWAGKFKETVANELIFQAGILERETKRFQQDYGSVTPDISAGLKTLISTTNDVNTLITPFASMASISAVLTSIAAVLGPLVIIVGVQQVLDKLVLNATMQDRQKAIQKQTEVVQNLVEAYKAEGFQNSLRKFEKPLEKPKTDWFLIGIITAIASVFTLAIIKKATQ